jgi:hypothetical protein
MNMAARRIAWIVVVTLVGLARASFAQEFQLWISKEDLFGANFPGEPVVTTITWTTEHGAQVPARVYTATRGPRTYSVTAVDYNQVKDILIANAKKCPPGLERCNGLTSFSGEGYWKTDLRGATIYAAFKIMKRPDVTVTHYMWNYLGGQAIEANELQFTNNKDQSRTHATIYMHHNRLYIMEETVPANFPAPGLFVQSMSLREADGTEANHQRMYFNGPEVDPTETNQFYRGGRGAR